MAVYTCVLWQKMFLKILLSKVSEYIWYGRSLKIDLVHWENLEGAGGEGGGRGDRDGEHM